MHARLSTYSGPVEGLDEMVQGFAEASEELGRMEGFEAGYVMVDRASGKAATITLWASEETAEASAQSANQMRSRVAQAGSHTVDSVETYEVAFSTDR